MFVTLSATSQNLNQLACLALLPLEYKTAQSSDALTKALNVFLEFFSKFLWSLVTIIDDICNANTAIRYRLKIPLLGA